MTYSYDRTKTAASMDFFREWREIVDKHHEAESREFAGLLKKAVPYLKSVGYDLDLNRSYLSKYHHGSDGFRIEGVLTITEREENNTTAPNPQSASDWVARALDVRGSAKLIAEGPGTTRSGEPIKTWQVDISAS